MTNREGHSNSLARQLTLLGASSLTVMAGATIAPSLPEIAAHFADVPDVALLSRLVITIPALAIALVAPLAGYIIDRFGRRRMLLGGIAVYALAGSSGLWLDNLGSILVGRAVLGCTIGAVMTTSITLVSDYFVGPARERFMGMQTACMGLGGVVFLGLGGLLAEVHWRGPFAVYLAAALLVPLAMVTIVEPERGGQAGAGHGPVVGLSRALVAYIAGLYALVITVMIAFYLVPVQLPFHLHEMGIESPGLIGLAIALSSLAGASGSFASPRGG